MVKGGFYHEIFLSIDWKMAISLGLSNFTSGNGMLIPVKEIKEINQPYNFTWVYIALDLFYIWQNSWSCCYWRWTCRSFSSPLHWTPGRQRSSAGKKSHRNFHKKTEIVTKPDLDKHSRLENVICTKNLIINIMPNMSTICWYTLIF